jgi:DNA-binding NarL/FixJ family response regulator
MEPNYQIILAEDHVRFRGEIKKIINEIPGVALVGEAGEGHELFELLETSRPDLLLLDISMPNLRGMQATHAIKCRYPEVKVILMVMDKEKEYFSHAIAAGADGILLKQNSAIDLRPAIQKIRRGGRYFPGLLEEKRYGGDTEKINPFGCLTLLSFF